MDIFICTDCNYVMPSSVMMKSLSINNIDNEITFHVLVDKNVNPIHEDEMEAVIQYNPKHHVRFYEMNSVLNSFPQVGKVKKYLSRAAYFRLFVTDVIPDSVHKILYLDGDIIVRKSLTQLFNIDISNYAAGVIPDMAESKQDYKRLGYDKEYGYFNSGVLLINVDYWREHRLKDAYLDIIENHPEKILLHDQDVLNIVLYKQKYILPLTYNMQNGFFWKPEYTELGDKFLVYKKDLINAISDPVIVHYTDQKKPWHYEDCNPYGYEFMKYKKQTAWRYLPMTHCYKNRYRHFVAKVLRMFHLIPPTNTQEYLYLPLEKIISKE